MARARMVAGRAGLAVLLLVSSSCSFFIAGPGRDYKPDRPPRCETSRRLPVADAIGFAAFGLLSASLLATPNCDAGSEGCSEAFSDVGTALEVALAVPALVYGIATLVGFAKTNECCRAIGQYNAAHPPASSARLTHSTSSQSGQ